MLTALLLLSMGIANPPDPAPVDRAEDYEGPAVKRRVFPRYPDHAYRLNIEKLECKVRVFIDEGGKPLDVTDEDCFPALFESTARVVMLWRWYPATQSGEPVPSEFLVNVDYRLRSTLGSSITREQFDRILAAHGRLDDDASHCVMAVTVHRGADVTGLASNRAPGCMVLPTGAVKPPAGLFGEPPEPVTCVVEFNSREGTAANLEYGDCSRRARALTARLVRGWVWNSWEGQPQHYEVTVRWSPDPP